jgi:hypothetical protein
MDPSLDAGFKHFKDHVYAINILHIITEVTDTLIVGYKILE